MPIVAPVTVDQLKAGEEAAWQEMIGLAGDVAAALISGRGRHKDLRLLYGHGFNEGYKAGVMSVIGKLKEILAMVPPEVAAAGTEAINEWFKSVTVGEPAKQS
jgi:hypothetical protein